MSFEYPRQLTIAGRITQAFIHKTKTGRIYEFRFEHSIDGILSEISLCTRNELISKEFDTQLFNSPKWRMYYIDAFPLKAKALISTQGVGFEVFEIEILE